VWSSGQQIATGSSALLSSIACISSSFCITGDYGGNIYKYS
jgi:hypothetical protein